ncbi:hypothetical protein [Bacillus manliponensis]|nr:hypothetical protein [Bacillus manliponensis]
MKKTVTKVLGILTVFALTFGIYSPKEHNDIKVFKAEHGDYGG